MFTPPETRYVKSDGVHIAYQVLGDGPLDVVFVPGFVSNVEANWESPERANFFRRLASFCRLILFDKRGTGMSDRTSQVFSLEQRMHDVEAIMNDVGSERAALFGISEGGPMSILYAATYPERTVALVLYGTYAKKSWATDNPAGWTDERWATVLENTEKYWGTPKGIDLSMWAPSIANDERAASRFATYFRASASPGAALAVWQMNREIDVRSILSSVKVPTLVLHRTDERVIGIDQARRLAGRIPHARLFELPGIDHVPWVGDSGAIINQVEEFLTGTRSATETDRELATVLFADIVASTERAAMLGDSKWRELLESYLALARRQLELFRGCEVDTAGDGMFATFDGPARAIRCAVSIRQQAKALGIDVRAGVHTGEVETIGEKPGGLAVHIGARVMGSAGPGEVLVSSTVKDLVAGSGLQFEDRGVHTLKGVPGEWRLFKTVSG
jgi:pimeloyl-ACP methyl ester carboxylesterase/class 3 adenylate cyclase